VFDRDADTGQLNVRQSIADEKTSMKGLLGAVDVVVSPDGRFVYVSSGNFLGDYAVSVFQLSSAGRLGLIQEFFDGDQRLRDVSSGNDIAISPNGRYLYACSKRRDKLVRLHRDPGTGRLTKPEVVSVLAGAQPEWLTGLAVSPDGKILHAGTELSDAILTIATGDAQEATPVVRAVPLPAEGKPAEAPTLTPSPQAATTAPAVLGQDEVARMTGHQAHVIEVAFSPDGRWAVSGSWDGTVRTWDVPSGSPLRRIAASRQQILAVACSPDGRRLAGGGVDNVIRLWDSQTGEEQRQLRGSSGFVSALAFSPDGKQLLSAAGDRKVRLWDSVTGEEVRVYPQTMEVIRCVAFSPTGRLALCSGGYFNNSKTEQGEMLRVWDLESGNTVFRLQPKVRSVISKAAFSPDGRRVAATDLDDHGLGVWDLEKGLRVQLLKPRGSIQDFAFTPDGRFILSGNAGNTMVLSEIESASTIRNANVLFLCAPRRFWLRPKAAP
jgi:WD40 repeat protein